MSTTHVSVRLDPATMARVDAVGPLFSTEWRTANRSDILRGLILDALERLERGGRPQTTRSAWAAAESVARRSEKAGAGARKAKRGVKPKR